METNTTSTSEAVMPDPIKFADMAEKQSDRWLLMLILGVSFLCVLFMMKWFTRRLDEQRDVSKVLFEKANDSNLHMTAALTSTANTVQQCAKHIEENTEFMRKVNDHLVIIVRRLETEEMVNRKHRS